MSLCFKAATLGSMLRSLLPMTVTVFRQIAGEIIQHTWSKWNVALFTNFFSMWSSQKCKKYVNSSTFSQLSPWFNSPVSPVWGRWVCCWSCEVWVQGAPRCSAGPAWHLASSWRASGTVGGSAWLKRCPQHSQWWGESWTDRTGCSRSGQEGGRFLTKGFKRISSMLITGNNM